MKRTKKRQFLLIPFLLIPFDLSHFIFRIKNNLLILKMNFRQVWGNKQFVVVGLNLPLNKLQQKDPDKYELFMVICLFINMLIATYIFLNKGVKV